MIDFDFRGSGKTAAQYWADEAVRHSNRAVKFGQIAFWLMVLSATLQLIALVLRLS